MQLFSHVFGAVR